MHHGLNAGRQIDDRQPPMREPDHGGSLAGVIQEQAFAVRTAMSDAVAHRPQPALEVRPSLLKNEAGYAAHILGHLVRLRLRRYSKFRKTLEERHRR